MFADHRIVCITPAGRRRYLRLLIPYVLSCPNVDRYDLWINTPDEADLAVMKAVAEIDDRIRLVPLPAAVEPGPNAIREFWPNATEDDAVYLRFDDDVVWLDPKFFETFLSFRIAHPEYFTVTPLVINNALSTYLLKTFGKIKTSAAIGPDRFDRFSWVNPTLAHSLHTLFLEMVARGEVERLACGRIPLSANCFSINCISWFGRDFEAAGGRIPDGEDEEAAASCTLPLRAGRLNAVETSAVAAHFAFYTQREWMDRSGLLDDYLRLAAGRSELEPWRSRVEEIYAAVEKNNPVHLSLGGFTPMTQAKRPFFKRLLRPRRPATHEVITVERGPNF